MAIPQHGLFIYRPSPLEFVPPDSAYLHHMAKASKWDVCRMLGPPRPNPMEMLDERSKARWLCAPKTSRLSSTSQRLVHTQHGSTPAFSQYGEGGSMPSSAPPFRTQVSPSPSSSVADPLQGGYSSASNDGAASAFDLFDGSLRVSGVRSQGVIGAPTLHEQESHEDAPGTGASSVSLARAAPALRHDPPPRAGVVIGGASRGMLTDGDANADTNDDVGDNDNDDDEIAFAGEPAVQHGASSRASRAGRHSEWLDAPSTGRGDAARPAVASSVSTVAVSRTALAVAAASGVQAIAFSMSSLTAGSTGAARGGIGAGSGGAAAMPGPPVVILSSSGSRQGEAVKRRLDGATAASVHGAGAGAASGAATAAAAAPGAAKRQRIDAASGSDGWASAAGTASTAAGLRGRIGAAAATGASSSVLSSGSASASLSAAGSASAGASSAMGVRRLSNGGAKPRAAAAAASSVLGMSGGMSGHTGTSASVLSSGGIALSGTFFSDPEPCIAPSIDGAPPSFDGTAWVQQQMVAGPSFLLSPQHSNDGGSSGSGGASGPLAAMFRASAASGMGGASASSGPRHPPAMQSAIETLRRLLASTLNLAERRVLESLQAELRATEAARTASAADMSSERSSSSTIDNLCWTLVGHRGHPASTLAAVFLVCRDVSASEAPTAPARSFYCLPLCSHRLLSEALRLQSASPVTGDFLSREDRWRGLGSLLCDSPSVPKATHDAKSLLYSLLRCPLTAHLPFHAAYIWDTAIAAYMLCPDAAAGTTRIFSSEHLLPRGGASSSLSESEARLRGLGIGGSIELRPNAEAFSFDNIMTVFRPGSHGGAAGAAAGAGTSGAGAGAGRFAGSGAAAAPGSLSVLTHLQQLAEMADTLSVCLDAHGLLAPFLLQESRLLPALAACEVAGIGFDAAPLERVMRDVQARIAALEAEAHALAGRPFLVTSSQQVAQVLYDEIGLVPPAMHGQGGDAGGRHTKNARKGEARHQSAGEAQLVALSGVHPLPAIILQHRKLRKLESTYMHPLVEAAAAAAASSAAGSAAATTASLSSSSAAARHGAPAPQAGVGLLPAQRIHTQLQQTHVGTGRLSSTSPNLQSLPRAEGGPAAPAADTSASAGGSAAAGGASGAGRPATGIEAQDSADRFKHIVRTCFVANGRAHRDGQSRESASSGLGLAASLPSSGTAALFGFGPSSMSSTASSSGASSLLAPAAAAAGAVAGRGRVLLSLDYSQIEVRVMAHLARDEGLMRVFATAPAPPHSAATFAASGAAAGAAGAQAAGFGAAGSAGFASFGGTAGGAGLFSASPPSSGFPLPAMSSLPSSSAASAAGAGSLSLSSSLPSAAASSSASSSSGDVYCRMASAVYRTPLAAVTPAMRAKAKTVVLGIMYGQGKADMARKLAVSVGEAEEARAAFLRAYPAVQRFTAAAEGFARRHGYVVTLAGRKRWLRDIGSADKKAASYGERQAVNSVVQGSAADIVKAAVFAVDAWLRCGMDMGAKTTAAGSRGASSAMGASAESSASPDKLPLTGARLLLQIHDELLFEVPDDPSVIEAFVRTAARHLTVTAPRLVAETANSGGGIANRAASGEPAAVEAMNLLLGGTCQLRVPLPINAKVGHSWGTMQEYKP